MVMVAFRVGRVDFIAAASIAELHLLQDAEVRKQFERAIDGREADLGFPLAQDVVAVLCREMFARMVEEDLQDDLALRRHLVLALLQLLLEVFHGICLCHTISIPFVQGLAEISNTNIITKTM